MADETRAPGGDPTHPLYEITYTYQYRIRFRTRLPDEGAASAIAANPLTADLMQLAAIGEVQTPPAEFAGGSYRPVDEPGTPPQAPFDDEGDTVAHASTDREPLDPEDD